MAKAAQKRKADYTGGPSKKAKNNGSQYVSPKFKGTSTYRKMVNRGFLGAYGEAKYFDVAAGSIALNTTGSVTQLDSVPTGTTVNSRDGRKFKLTSFQVRGIAGNDTTGTSSLGAMYLVWDRQPNKALAGVTDILDAATPVAFAKRENVQRFKIIKKWRWCFNGNGATAGQQTATSAFDIDDYVKLPDECVAECTTADTTGAIGNRVTGALLLVCVGNKAGPATDDDYVTITTRVNFSDL